MPVLHKVGGLDLYGQLISDYTVDFKLRCASPVGEGFVVSSIAVPRPDLQKYKMLESAAKQLGFGKDRASARDMIYEADIE